MNPRNIFTTFGALYQVADERAIEIAGSMGDKTLDSSDEEKK